MSECDERNGNHRCIEFRSIDNEFSKIQIFSSFVGKREIEREREKEKYAGYYE